MERQLVAKPGTPEAKTNDCQPFSLSHEPHFPTRGILHSEKLLSNRPSLHPAKLQAKLAISQPGDPYEQEADRVADMVMRMPEPSASPIEFSKIPIFPGRVQRKCPNSCKQNPGFNSSGSSADRILRLQKTAGNQAVQRLIKSGALQAKLKIGQPNDIYEQEADRVAEQVMSMPEPMVRRQSEEEKEEEVPIQAKPIAEQITPLVQRQVEEEGKTVKKKESTGKNAPIQFLEVGGSFLARYPLLPHPFETSLNPRDLSNEELEQEITSIRHWLLDNPGSSPEHEHFTASMSILEDEVMRRQTPERRRINVPEFQNVDGQFWIMPPLMGPNARPVYDDEDTRVVVGFRYYSVGYYKVYDLEGRLVETGERSLEAPLISPIDILAGGITGLGRGLLKSGGRIGLRGISGGFGRSAVVSSAGRAGFLLTIRLLSRRAIVAVRGIYRAIRFRGTLNFTATTAARMANPARRVPQHILKLAIRFGRRSPDPQGASGAFQYVTQIFKNGRQYTLEVVIREADKTILHFMYYP